MDLSTASLATADLATADLATANLATVDPTGGPTARAESHECDGHLADGHLADDHLADCSPAHGPLEAVHAALVAEQQTTLATPRRRYGLLARTLFIGMDAIYGRQASLPKFAVLELVARVPYQTWEHAAYVAITRHAGEVRAARRIHERVCRARDQQDNEQWHLFILEEILEQDGVRLGWFRYRFVPQLIAFVYYTIAFAMYLVKPQWSHSLNADFEDHAEHEYMAFVADHPELDGTACSCTIAPDYGTYGSVADVLRRIGLDEREHKLESVAELDAPRTRRSARSRVAVVVLAAALGIGLLLR